MVNSNVLLTLALGSAGALGGAIKRDGVVGHPVAFTPDGKPIGCEEQYNNCRTAPNANMAVCASEHEICLGHPAKRDGIVGTPVAFDPDGNRLSCEQLFNDCRSAPGANMAVCSAEKAKCEKFEPSSSTTASAPSATTSSASGDDCDSKFNACRTAPGANMAVCAAENAKCKGEEKGETSTSTSTSSATNGPAKTASPTTSPSETPVSPSSQPSSPPENAAGRVEQIGGSLLAAFLVAVGLF
ncbi:hypothetical protein AJ79_02692 [Helicocarpus griseus UAMH5409]|uniref:Uncharacterized protein n=1 Tax=Helicocarpus griseus UAMH5409 TaxID=1447875 RepID=A0A2B7Y2C7_9EURO|nr:hypothetical protein AJ79_02692 [Helicocarpus griseus UAMH5409]